MVPINVSIEGRYCTRQEGKPHLLFQVLVLNFDAANFDFKIASTINFTVEDGGEFNTFCRDFTHNVIFSSKMS